MSDDEVNTKQAWSDHVSHRADARTLTALASTDAGDLTGPELVDAIVASEKALSLLAGLQMRLLSALAVPFVAGDPMRLAARLARKSCLTGDDDPKQVQLFVEEAATCLAASEVAAALRISPVTGGIRVREAEVMTTVLLPTLHALEDGVLDRGKARIIAEHCQPLSPENTAQVQDLVLLDAQELSNSELRELASQAVIVVDPEGAEERHNAAAITRGLTLRAQPDAMATLSAFLTADGAVKIFQISDLLATSTAGVAGDSRGIGARRVDALVDIADQLITHGYLDLADFIGTTDADATPSTDGRTHPAPTTPSSNGDACNGDSTPATPGDADANADALTQERSASRDHTEQQNPTPNSSVDPAPPAPATTPVLSRQSRAGRTKRVLTRQGRRPHLSVTIGLDTLAGLNELPGTLAGFGAIPACLARAIAISAGTITALMTDPATGVATNAGALTYRPTQKLRDQVAALYNTCQFPSCRQPVWRCDIDHRQPFDHNDPAGGGRTDEANTGPFCRRHHLMKHHTDWQMTVNPRLFTLEWTSPTGHRYSTRTRPAAVPDIRNMTARVTNPGSAIADRLDIRAAFNNVSEPTPGPLSVVEELGTALLLRHELNQPDIELDPTESHWDTPAGVEPDIDSGHGENPWYEIDNDLPDAPPF